METRLSHVHHPILSGANTVVQYRVYTVYIVYTVYRVYTVYTVCTIPA